MAKRLLLNALINVLGEFIEINEENLNLAVWSGQIVLHDLKIRTDKLLRDHNFSVVRGVIKTLEVTIPWTSLFVSPIKIVINGVYLQVGPLDTTKMERSAMHKRVLEEKMAKLQLLDKYMQLSTSLESNLSSKPNTKEVEQSSYLQQWTTKIIDNIEISVSNLHIRYEDSTTIRNKLFSCGFTLASFEIFTCDNNWQKTFSPNPTSQSATPVSANPSGCIYKLANVYNFGMYWNTKSKSKGTLGFESLKDITSITDWESAMQSLIYSRKSPKTPLQYIVFPYNNLVMRFTHNKENGSLTNAIENPTYDILMQSTNLSVTFDSEQYEEIFHVVDRMVSILQINPIDTYYPARRPESKYFIKAWWKYACKLVILKPKYIKLVKKEMKYRTENQQNPGSVKKALSRTDAKLLENIHRRVPLQALRNFRREALTEYADEEHRKSTAKQSDAINPTNTWWNYWVGTAETGVESNSVKNVGAMVDDISLESIVKEQLQQDSKTPVTNEKHVEFAINLETSAQIVISQQSAPILLIKTSTSSSIMKSVEGLAFKCQVRQLSVMDKWTVYPPIAEIVKVKKTVNTNETDAILQAFEDPTFEYSTDRRYHLSSDTPILCAPIFLVSFEQSTVAMKRRTKLFITALPIELTLNKDCIQCLIKSFARPNTSYKQKSSLDARAVSKPSQIRYPFLTPTNNSSIPVPTAKATSSTSASPPMILKPSAPIMPGATALKLRKSVKLTTDAINKLMSINDNDPAATTSQLEDTDDEDEIDIVITLHAPKIIIPEDCGKDMGYLLLDTGNLDMKGCINSSGFTFDITLKDVHAGLPRTAREIHFVGNSYLYLIKPFDIILTVHNLALSVADMSVELELLPEVRGEIDSDKLSSLLKVVSEVSAMFASPANKPIPDTQDTTTKVVQDGQLLSQNLSNITPVKSSRTISQSSANSHSPFNYFNSNELPSKSADKDSTLFYTPISSAKIQPTASTLIKPPIIESQKSARGNPFPISTDPTRQFMLVSAKIPSIALDLTYNVSKGYHLVLTVTTLITTVTTRPYDRKILLDLNEVSIKDSFRSVQQSELAWTPKNTSKLFHVTYITIFNKLSPLYKRHGVEVKVNFASLNLNVDVNTVRHLKPFFEVLLSRKAPNNSSIANSETENKLSVEMNSAPTRPTAPLDSNAPIGMHIDASLDTISLDILRNSANEVPHADLDTAYSMTISFLQADIDMADLLHSDVTLHSFEIFDARKISKDYVIRRIFCPVSQTLRGGRGDSSKGLAERLTSSEFLQMLFENTSESKNPTNNGINLIENKDAENLLHVSFVQETKTNSLVTVSLSNVTTFIAIDTILDFTNLATANAFAFLDLLSNPDANNPTTKSNLKSNLRPNLAKLGSGFQNIDLYAEEVVQTPDEGGRVDDKRESPPLFNRSIADISSNVINVVVKIIKPKSVLLEDPTSSDSQALITNCDIDVHYTREVTTTTFVSSLFKTKKVLFESLHITVNNCEAFVIPTIKKNLLNIQSDYRSILDPIALECHIKRRTVNDVNILTDIMFDVDHINTRLSFNDIFLVQNILSRRTLYTAATETDSETISRDESYDQKSFSGSDADLAAFMDQDGSEKNITSMESVNEDVFFEMKSQVGSEYSDNSGPSNPIFRYDLHLGSISMVTVNDFNQQQIPVLQLIVNELRLCIEMITQLKNVWKDSQLKSIQQPRHVMKGEGGFKLCVDFFNTKLSTWEPLVEKWRPKMTLFTVDGNTLCKIHAEHTLQSTVSGQMLETILRTYSMLFIPNDEESNSNQEQLNRVKMDRTSFDLQFNNLLGEDVDLHIIDSASKVCLCHLSGSKNVTDSTPARSIESSNRPVILKPLYNLKLNFMKAIAVDIHFGGKLGDERFPLRHLPLNVNKVKSYHLQPRPRRKITHGEDSQSINSSNSKEVEFEPLCVVEPIEEEVYQNCRYDPILGSWRPPFLFGDPFEWTDASGLIRKDIQSVQLPNDQWEWQGKWEVDRQGIIGTEIDPDGFEYATTFSLFSVVSARRVFQTFDCVRRRRWIRTRARIISSRDPVVRPITIFWDVQTLKNGTRKVDIRSGIQLQNELSYPVLLRLSHNSWQSDVILGPVLPTALFSVPLSYVYLSSISIKPDFPSYEWSQELPCSLNSQQFHHSYHLQSSNGTEADSTSCCFQFEMKHLTNRSLSLRLLPYVIITNQLLIDMKYECVALDGKTESGVLESGGQDKFLYMNLFSNPQIRFQMNGYEWSEESSMTDYFREIIFKNSQFSRRNLLTFVNKNEVMMTDRMKVIHLHRNLTQTIEEETPDCLTLCLKFHLQTVENILSISLYSKYIAVDRTGLKLIVRSRIHGHQFTERKTSKFKKDDIVKEIHKDVGSVNLSSAMGPISVDLLDHQSHLVDDAATTTTRSDIYKDVLKQGKKIILSRSTSELMGDGSSVSSQESSTDIRYNQVFSNIRVNSIRKYSLTHAEVSSDVYTDCTIKWSYLPSFLHRQIFIATSFEDRNVRTNKLIQLNLRVSSIVLVMVDSRINPPMKWLKSEGFKKLPEIVAIAHRILRNTLQEFHFVAYGKYVAVATDDDEDLNHSTKVEKDLMVESPMIDTSPIDTEDVMYSIHEVGLHDDGEVTLRGTWEQPLTSMYTVSVIPYDPVRMDSNHSNVSKSRSNDTSNLTSHSVDKGKILDILYRQIMYDQQYDRQTANRAWTEGRKHVCMFHSENNLIQVGTSYCKDWSEEFNLDLATQSDNCGSFSINPKTSKLSYQIAFRMEHLPGLYSSTVKVVFYSRYTILNCMDEPLMIAQKGSDNFYEFLPYVAESWHLLERRKGTEVHLQTRSSIWSLGVVDLNEIGANVLYLPYKSDYRKLYRGNGAIVHVEVKLGSLHDNSAVIIVVWKETIENNPSMSICNYSDVPITLRQSDIDLEYDIKGMESLYELVIPPHESIPFGWVDPDCSTNLLVCVGNSMDTETNKRIATMDIMKKGEKLRLPYASSNFNQYSRGQVGIGNKEVILSVVTKNGSRILSISPETRKQHLDDHLMNEEDDSGPSIVMTKNETVVSMHSHSGKSLRIDLLFASLGVSLVVEKPTRRELLSLYLDDVEIRYTAFDLVKSIDFKIMDLQLDNYSETQIHPILLRSNKKEIHRSVLMAEDKINLQNKRTAEEYSNDKESVVSSLTSVSNTAASSTIQRSDVIPTESSMLKPNTIKKHAKVHRKHTNQVSNLVEVPFLQFTGVYKSSNHGVHPAKFQYIGLRILPIVIEVDSASIQLLFIDLLNDLKVLTHSEALANEMPKKWANDFNFQIFHSDSDLLVHDIYEMKLQSQRSKIYFERLVIHPMKFTLTFIQTIFPRRQHEETLQSTVLNVIMSLAGVEHMQMRTSSFEVEELLESIPSLWALILSKSIKDVQSQLGQIAASLVVFGSPIGFARKVGKGVKAFFYEPYQGAVQSSSDFFIGIGKGTSSLVGGFVSGAMDSALAIAGTASKGLAHMSGDADYARKRAIKRQQHRANQGGIVEGIRFGGESFMSGITSGVTGLLFKPFQEASRGGVQGFLRGFGLGLVGAAIKPAMGLTEGFSSIAYSISHHMDPNKVSLMHVRPPRALEPSSHDPTELIISPINLQSAYEQVFVLQRAKKSGYTDSFICCIPLDSLQGEASSTTSTNSELISYETIILTSKFLFWRKPTLLWGRIWASISHCVFMGDTVGIMLYLIGSNRQSGTELSLIPCGSHKCAQAVYAVLTQNSFRMGFPSKVIPYDVLFRANSPMSSEMVGLLAKNPAELEKDVKSMSSPHDCESSHASESPVDSEKELIKKIKEAAFPNAIDGYIFGSANLTTFTSITGSESDVILRGRHSIEEMTYHSWKELDERLWGFIAEWRSIHSQLQKCRCCVSLFINKTDCPIQLSRVQIIHGRHATLFGSSLSGYDAESRLIKSNGVVVVFVCGFPNSPLEAGHLKVDINSEAFHVTIASTITETTCNSKEGYTIGFLEKTTHEHWSKYVLVIEMDGFQ